MRSRLAWPRIRGRRCGSCVPSASNRGPSCSAAFARLAQRSQHFAVPATLHERMGTQAEGAELEVAAVIAAAKGDAAAIAALVERSWDRAYRLAWRLLRHPEAGEDVA